MKYLFDIREFNHLNEFELFNNMHYLPKYLDRQ